MKIKGNKKGFTLVELLAVIVVLAIIMIIAIPAVVESMNNAKKGSFKIYAQRALGNAESTFQSEDLLGTLPTDKNDDNRKKIGDNCYCYTLAGIGLTSSGNFKGYVTVSLDDKREATYRVTLTDNSYSTKGSTYTDLNTSSNIANGSGGITSSCASATCSTSTPSTTEQAGN